MEWEKQVQAFLDAIKSVESGGNYQARNPISGAYGAYQFIPRYWPERAAAAGIAGADIRDPAAQDRVARHMVTSYYRDLGSWELAAMAWMAPAVAKKAKTQGIDNVSFSDSAGHDIHDYVSKVNRAFSERGGPVWRSPASNPGHLADPAATQPVEGAQGLTGGTFGAAETMNAHPLMQVLDSFSRSSAGGQRASLSSMMDSEYAEPGAGTNDLSQMPSGFEDLFDWSDNAVADGQVWSAGTAPSGDYYNLTNAQRLNNPRYQSVAKAITDVVVPEMKALFPTVSVGQYRDLNVRPEGGAKNSDHYWGGGLDLTIRNSGGGYDMEAMDNLNRWFQDNAERLGVRYTIWRAAHHYDHVHVSFLPPSESGHPLHKHVDPEDQATTATPTGSADSAERPTQPPPQPPSQPNNPDPRTRTTGGRIE